MIPDVRSKKRKVREEKLSEKELLDQERQMACTKRLKRRTRIHFVCPEGGELTERKTKVKKFISKIPIQVNTKKIGPGILQHQREGEQAIDSEEVVTPLMLDGTYLSINRK